MLRGSTRGTAPSAGWKVKSSGTAGVSLVQGIAVAAGHGWVSSRRPGTILRTRDRSGCTLREQSVPGPSCAQLGLPAGRTLKGWPSIFIVAWRISPCADPPPRSVRLITDRDASPPVTDIL